MTTAIICGGRSYGIVPSDHAPAAYERLRADADREKARLAQILSAAVDRLGVVRMVMGDQKGADYLASSWCYEHDVPFQIYEANWQGLGRAAGPARNLLMIKSESTMPAICIAFPGSRGTRDMVKQAEAHFLRIIKVDWA